MSPLWLSWLACTGAPDEEPPAPVADRCLAPSGEDTGFVADSGDPGWLLDCAVAEVPELVTARRIVLSLAQAAEVRLCCTHQTEPSEVHVVRSPLGTEHDLGLQGLLASANYRCVADVGPVEDGREIAMTFSTDALPDWLHLPELSGDPAVSAGAYTLVNHFVNSKHVDEQKLMIFDRHGRVRWYLDLQDDITAVDATWLGDGTLLYGGGFGGAPRIVDLWGETVFQAEQPWTGVSHHHDVELLPSGRIASLVTTRDQLDGQEWTGFGVEVIDVPSGALVWAYDSQTAVDAGELQPGAGDPWHANALQIVERDGELQDVFVNLRDINQLVRIDPLSQRITSRLGPDGDYRLVDADGANADEADWFYWPHAPEVDGTRVLFYDNRNPRPNSETSRAAEFTLDPVAGTAELTWEWTERNFREQAWGDVDRLPSDDVLVTIAHCETCELSDPQGRSAVVEVDRASGDVLWRLTWPDADDGIYRADRIDGCDAFANRRYCPSIGLE